MNAHTFRTPINPGPGLPAGPGRPRSRTAAFRHAALAGALAAALPAPALALPGAPSVAGGSASFQQTGGTLTVINTPNAIINWGSFSIGANEITRFVQQSSASAVLNRVVGQDPSRILGQLQSNGRVFLINPNGVLFGAGARVDTAGLVASALNLSDADFLAGRLKFTGTGTAGKVENQGTISTGQGGFVYLIAPEVDNSGLIAAANGDILLAAGHSVEIADGLNPALRVQVTAPAGQVTNLGQLLAESGRIGLHGGLVANAGTVSASSAVAEGGRIYLRASQRIALTDTSRLLADGTRGGEITAIVAQGDRIAGELVGRGEIRARGDGSPGSGGFVETSAGWLDINALKVDTRGGTWLLDPDDVEINASATVTGATLVTPDTVQNALAQGDFVVQTRASETTGNGDIFVNARLAWDSNTLSLIAQRDISVNADVAMAGETLNLTAGRSLVLGGGARIQASGLAQIRVASIRETASQQVLVTAQDAPNQTLAARPTADQVLIDGRGVVLSREVDQQQSILKLSGGTLRGTGTVYGNLQLHGGARLAPGASPGTLTIAGNLTLTPASVLDVEVWGTSSGLYDLIAVTGTVTLDGALYAIVGGGYFPVQGDTVTFMTASGTSGAFASVNLYPGFTLNVLSNGLQLEATETVLSQPVLTALASNNANLYLGALSHETPLLYASGQGSPTASSTGALIQTAEMVLPALIPDWAPTTDPATETFAQSLARLLAQGLSPEEALKRASSAPGGQDGAPSPNTAASSQITNKAPLSQTSATDPIKDPPTAAFAQDLAQSLAQGLSPAEAIMRARLRGEFTRLILDTRQQEIPHESRLVCR